MSISQSEIDSAVSSYLTDREITDFQGGIIATVAVIIGAIWLVCYVFGNVAIWALKFFYTDIHPFLMWMITSHLNNGWQCALHLYLWIFFAPLVVILFLSYVPKAAGTVAAMAGSAYGMILLYDRVNEHPILFIVLGIVVVLLAAWVAWKLLSLIFNTLTHWLAYAFGFAIGFLQSKILHLGFMGMAAFNVLIFGIIPAALLVCAIILAGGESRLTTGEIPEWVLQMEQEFDKSMGSDGSKISSAVIDHSSWGALS